ncbi:hypothetical protein [Demequina lutea]|uniref:Replication protein n=1 Tax=Demequina lutea TaxID=431489 RepID=A0A7Y9ZCF8_9MICO|nr:hypothetical protein [Demequina lutea]NYI42804.1 hypothetical protein [Demequina lutea]
MRRVGVTGHRVRDEHCRDEDALASCSRFNEAWAAVGENTAINEAKKRAGVFSFFPVTEAVHDENGWNPHSHFVYLAKRPLTQAEESDLFIAWAAARRRTYIATGGAAPVLTGSEFERITDKHHSERLARYLTKQNFRHAVLLAREGGTYTSRHPWQILLDAMASNDSASNITLLNEYAEASRSKHTLLKTPNLQELLDQRLGGVDVGRRRNFRRKGNGAPPDRRPSIISRGRRN